MQENEIEEISDEKVTKISISGMLKEREKKKADPSPPNKNNEIKKEIINEEEVNETPKIKLSLGGKKVEAKKESVEEKIEVEIKKEIINENKSNQNSEIKLSLGGKKVDTKKEIENKKEENTVEITEKGETEKPEEIQNIISESKTEENNSPTIKLSLNKKSVSPEDEATEKDIVEKEELTKIEKIQEDDEKDDKQNEEKKEKITNIEIKENIEKENISINKKSDTIVENKVTITKEPEKNIKNIEEDKKEVKKEVKKEETVLFGDKVLIKEPDSIFSNYKSDFNVESNSIIDKLKKLKNIPKTRPSLIFGLVGLTVIVAGLVFYLDPENHNLDNYKTEIIGIEKNISGDKKPLEDKDKIKQNTIQDEFSENNINNKDEFSENIINNKNEVPWQNEVINKFGEKITFQSKADIKGIKIYKYKNVIYNNIGELNLQIEKDYKKDDVSIKHNLQEKEKLDRIKNFLIKSRKK